MAYLYPGKGLTWACQQGRHQVYVQLCMQVLQPWPFLTSPSLQLKVVAYDFVCLAESQKRQLAVSLEQLLQQLQASQIPERALMAWPYLHHLPA